MAVFIPAYTVTKFDIGTGTVNQCGGCCPFSWVTSNAGVSTDVSFLAGQVIVTGCRPVAFNLSITWDFFGANENRLQIFPDVGATYYDTGCVTGSGSTSIVVPAGSVTVRMVLTGNCANDPGAVDQWSVVVICT